MKTKKILFGIIAALTVIMVAGCSTTSKQTDKQNEPAKQTEKVSKKRNVSY
ncbi:hypothetical protein [Listeria grayi]|uniref:hypothetical protein n=1 Tax=Listeria grayi TaxID=1641 RepID=UPI0004B97429|nr:hypothetical protein [Listeria grayi]